MKYKVDKLVITYPSILGIFRSKKNVVRYRSGKNYELMYFCKDIQHIIYHGHVVTSWNDFNDFVIEPFEGKQLEVNIIDKAHKLVIFGE